jgi:hypothetical protein
VYVVVVVVVVVVFKQNLSLFVFGSLLFPLAALKENLFRITNFLSSLQSTDSLLILFWAEIYEQARSISPQTRNLRFKFFVLNAIVYVAQAACWIGEENSSTKTRSVQNGWILAAAAIRLCAFLAASIGFATYGGLLFFMLRKFPNDAVGKSRKLFEVGIVTASCTACFTFRAVCILVAAIVPQKFPLDVVADVELNAIYYIVSEVAPSARVLFALRKLPPKQRKNQREGRATTDLDDMSDEDEEEEEEEEEAEAEAEAEVEEENQNDEEEALLQGGNH